MFPSEGTDRSLRSQFLRVEWSRMLGTHQFLYAAVSTDISETLEIVSLRAFFFLVQNYRFMNYKSR